MIEPGSTGSDNDLHAASRLNDQMVLEIRKHAIVDDAIENLPHLNIVVHTIMVRGIEKS